jgi:azurin
MRMFRLSSMFIAVLSLSAAASAQALKTAAPAATDRTPAQARTITITGGDDMKYNVTTITAKRGETLKIRLTSKGTIPKVAMAHNVVILKPGTNVAKFIDAGVAFRQDDFIAPALKSTVLAQTSFAGPGETVELTFKVPAKAATYPFVCTFSGHFAAGMAGTIVVK